MYVMGKYRIEHRYVDSIQCPVDLDSLIMCGDCTPEHIEENLGVGQDIMWDAIRLSTCQYWLLKIDVMERFTSGFRNRIYSCLPTFSRLNRKYFRIRLALSGNVQLQNELESWDSENGSSPDGNTNLLNPMNMLSNDLKDYDMRVIGGKMPLRNFILERIQQFLKTGDRDKVDFSCSLFLPEILNPKFFSGLSEAEHIVLLGNLDKYFRFVEKFNRTGMGLRGSYQPRHELNDPQNLLKHVLSGNGNYTRRVKMLAWKQLYKEVDHLMASASWASVKMFDVDAMDRKFSPVVERLKKEGLGQSNVIEWLDNANGVFESFELDCTLHNLDAADFLPAILTSRPYYRMSEGLVDFQDDDTRDRLFKVLSESMVSFR